MNLLTKVRGIWAHGDEDEEENDRDFDAEDDDYNTDYTRDKSYSSYNSDSSYESSYSTGKYASSAYPEGRSYAGTPASTPGGASQASPSDRAPMESKTTGSTVSSRMRTMNPTLRAREKNIYTIKPKRLDEATVAADCLKTGSAVIVNLESVDRVTAVRIVDFMSGVCYGIDGAQGQAGNAMKLGDMIFLFTPAEFDISSDENDYSANEEHFFREMTDPQLAPSSAAPQIGSGGNSSGNVSSGTTPSAQSTPPAASGSSAGASSFASSYNSPTERRAWER